MLNPCACDFECKIDEYLDIKNYSCKKHVVVKLVLECKNKTSLDDKKETCKKTIFLFTHFH